MCFQITSPHIKFKKYYFGVFSRPITPYKKVNRLLKRASHKTVVFNYPDRWEIFFSILLLGAILITTLFLFGALAYAIYNILNGT